MPLPPAKRTARRTIPHVAASEFKATCLELMDEVARTGNELIVTKHGRPVVRLSAVVEEHLSPWGFLAGSVIRHGDIVSADDEAWAPTETDPLVLRRGR